VLLLATAGGGGEAYDLCFFCPAFVGVVATALVAFVALARGAPRASVVAVVMAAILGGFVLLAVATNEPSADPDEQGSQQMLRSLLCMWVSAACISVTCAIAVALHRSASSRGHDRPEGRDLGHSE
jgi:hypothetical protein